MCDNLVDLNLPHTDVHRIGLRPADQVFVADLLDIMFIEIDLVRIFQEDRKCTVVQSSYA